MDVTKYISHQIQSQFPAIYQQDGPELVEFVRTYYDFLEKDVTGYYLTGYTFNSQSEKSYFSTRYDTYNQAAQALESLQSNTDYKELKITNVVPQTTFHNRRMFDYGDIDSTLENMLLFYKNKYLNDLPLINTDTRFIVKHILDFYRRKGSREGLELFFRLFYSENSTVYYPSQDILKPSASRWKSSIYVELFPQDVDILKDAQRLPVTGSVSGATAVIDRTNYIIVGNTFVPVVYLSNTKGKFVAYDSLINNGQSYGLVRGSLDTVTFSESDVRLNSSNNNVGDIVSIFSDTGYAAKGRVSRVSSDLSGIITFVIEDGGFGYTTTNTDIIVSDQTLFINDTVNRYIPLETVHQPSNGATGVIIGQRDLSSETTSIGVLLSSSNTFTVGAEITTVNRDINITGEIQFASLRNDSAYAEIGDDLTNVQTISIIVDIIGDFLNVPLNSTNYSDMPPALNRMTGNAPFGTPAITITTPINEAFIPQTLQIGTINSLKNVDPGSDYVNDTFVLARDNVISRFNLANQVINFNPLTGGGVEIGDIVVQNDPTIDNTNLGIRGVVKSRVGDYIEVMQLTFKGFTSANSIFIEGTTDPIEVYSVERNYNTLPLGFNADIDGFVTTAIGKIEAVEVIDSGFGFVDQTRVSMTNDTKAQTARMSLEAALRNPNATQQIIQQLEDELTFHENAVVARGTGGALSQGRSAGVWESKTSHLNSKQVLQDSFFYQDFSYQVTTRLNPSTYANTLKNLAHVAGTKAFYKFGLEEEINTTVSVDGEIILYNASTISIATEDQKSMFTEDEKEITGVQYQIIELKV